MAKSFSASVLLVFVAAVAICGCDSDQSTTPSAHASTGAHSAITQQELSEPASEEDSAPDAESTRKPPPEWSLQVTGPYAASKRGRSAAYTYIDGSLHMRLLYKPSVDAFHQGLTFHLPSVAMGYEGPVEANYARLDLGDEGLSCTTRAEDTAFSVELSEFSRDVRVGTYKGRLLCNPIGDDEEPKYVDVSGSFRDD